MGSLLIGLVTESGRSTKVFVLIATEPGFLRQIYEQPLPTSSLILPMSPMLGACCDAGP